MSQPWCNNQHHLDSVQREIWRYFVTAKGSNLGPELLMVATRHPVAAVTVMATNRTSRIVLRDAFRKSSLVKPHTARFGKRYGGRYGSLLPVTLAE
eukprot:271449-Prymnesium_polylepis.1